MTIVKLEREYLKFIRENKTKFHEEGIGLFFYYKGFYVFIPITSKKRIIPTDKNFKIDKKNKIN